MAQEIAQLDELVGQRVWVPKDWEEVTLDSFLIGAGGQVVCHVFRRDDGSKFAMDNQMRPLEGFEG
tara:strand:+ start:1903 stop:2100 length:198 start_codon:yes stop_codon:yes gene_type:complete